MNTAVTLQDCTAFGLRIASEIPLPELPPATGGMPAEAPADVHIGYEDLEELWARLGGGRGSLTVREGLVLFEVAGVARYCVREGRSISVAPFPGSDPGRIRLYILGTCMGALLLQRGVLPLHGSAVAAGGSAYAIVGDSGAGKSTLCAALLERGCAMVSDDVIAVDIGGGGGEPPTVRPAYPQQKLWRRSLDEFGMEAGGFSPLHGEAEKFAVPVAHRFHGAALPLGGVFELVPEDRADVCFESLGRLESLPVLTHHTYRQFLVVLMGRLPWQFDQLAALAAAVPVFRIRRPSGRFTAHELAERILSATAPTHPN